MRIREVATVLLASACTLLVSSSVLAHIDPDPIEAQAGSRLSVRFTVEHGCDGSPTTSLDMRLPVGVTDATPEAPQGWEGSIADNVVTFVGGPLLDDQELTFSVALTLPPTPDTTVYFPFVQRCEVGEIRWIDVPSDGSGDELDEPAPAMALIGPVAAATTTPLTTTTLPPGATSPSTPTTASTTSTSPSTTTTEPVVTNVPVDTVQADTSATIVDLTTEAGSGAGGGGAFAAVGAGLAVTIAVAGGVFYLRRRRS